MRFVFTALVVGLACCASRADVIELKNGQKVVGAIRGLEKGKLFVVVGGQQQEVRMSTVQSFVIGDGNGAAKDATVADGERLSLADCEVGKQGFISATLKVESAEEDRFIGSYQIVAEGIVRGERATIIQGVDTASLISGKFVRLEQRLKCVGTENLGNGQTVYVFEPVQPDQRTVSKGEDPALSRPVPGGVRVAPIR
jgi:hypothetical protein